VFIVSTGKGGAHLRAAKTTTATATCVEEEDLDGDVRDRMRCVSSTDSLQQLAPGWSNAAALRSSSTTPAVQASTN
jgi:hypothetical protein